MHPQRVERGITAVDNGIKPIIALVFADREVVIPSD